MERGSVRGERGWASGEAFEGTAASHALVMGAKRSARLVTHNTLSQNSCKVGVRTQGETACVRFHPSAEP